MRFSQSKSRKQAGGDILRIPQVGLDCRYSKYHNLSNRPEFADMLEISQVLQRFQNLWYIANITCFGVPCEPQHIVVFYLTLAAYCDVNQLNGLAISV